MQWLVTRPDADARILARDLRKIGHQAIVSPMMSVVPSEFAPLDWPSFDAVIFTSRNAVIHGGPFPPVARSRPVFTVGEATAAAVRAAGFGNVTSANGNIDNLAARLGEKPHRELTRYVHICGHDTKGDLGAALAKTGARVEKAVVYAVRPAQALSPEALKAFGAGTLDGAIFLSPKTARVFAGLAKEASLGPFADKFEFAVISKAAADELYGLGGRIRVAEHPDLQHVLTLLP